MCEQVVVGVVVYMLIEGIGSHVFVVMLCFALSCCVGMHLPDGSCIGEDELVKDSAGAFEDAALP